MVKVGAPLKIPAPNSKTKPNEPYFIPWSHIQALYEQEKQIMAKKMAKKAKEWFHTAALAAGWAAAAPMKNATDQHGAGFVVWTTATPAKPASPSKPASPAKAATPTRRLTLVLEDFDSANDTDD